MKVLIAYVFCTKGGVETAIKNRIQSIPKENCEIDLLFFQDYGGKSLFDDLPGKVYIENDGTKIGDIVIRNNYDLVITIDTYEMITYLKRANYAGKIGLEVHTTYVESLSYLKHLKKNDVTYIAVPSQFEKKLVLDYLNVDIKIFILPNSVNLELFHPIEFSKKPLNPILLWIGRLDEHKNWRAFLRICKEIHEQTNKKYEFWVLGGLYSEEKELLEFKTLMLNYNLHDSLRWIPKVEYDLVGRIYNYAAASGGAYIVTSTSESFGMTILEAMSCKCPTIANCVGALPEIVTKDTGLLIDCNNETPKNICRQILKHLNEKDKILKQVEHSYSIVKNTYSNESIEKKFLAEIKRLF